MAQTRFGLETGASFIQKSYGVAAREKLDSVAVIELECATAKMS